LIEKNIGYRGTNNALQSIDYQYNLRGWLTGINTVNVYGGQSILTPSGMGSGGISGLAVTPFLGEALAQGLTNDQNLQGKALLAPPVADNNVDLLSQVLTYGNPDSRTQATAQYNGNISSTTWQVAGRAKQAYGFEYDDLNRLTDAKYFDVTDNYSSSWNSNFSADNKFNEKLTYDLRGNIITLQRNGMNSNGWTGNNFVAGTYGLIDNLTYAYGAGNQLKSIAEASLPTKGFKTNPNATGDQYGYDSNGNLRYDKNKYIDSIEYNYLNLPIRIVIQNPSDAMNSGSIEFVYDATGAKLRKTVKYSNGSVRETWDYVNGVEYKNQILQRVAHSEGAVVRNDFGQYQHEYVLRDHLGNTRVTFTDGVNKGEPYWDWNTYTYMAPDNIGYDDGVITKDDIVQINHFYPFGLNMEGDWNGAPGKNKYQYNGKEWNDDFGLGWNDYGARFYDPALGRWNAVDPLAEKAQDWTPYRYGFNNPIKFIDPTGMAEDWIPEVTVEKDDKGKAKAAHVTLKAEKGDNAQTLAAAMGISEEKAGKLVEAGKKDDKGNLTSIELTDDIRGVKAIKAAAVNAVENPKMQNYNCWESAVAIIRDKMQATFSNIMSARHFISIMGDKNEFATNKGQLHFGDLLSMKSQSTVTHAASYLCTSQSGVKYYWSKDGKYDAPHVTTLNALERKYHNLFSVDTHTHFTPR
jgi:RHS repeat-associated protein